MRIAMIGSGYVGLVSGACLADFGHNVICVDKDEKRIAMLERGEIPIFEPGLDDLVATNAEASVFHHEPRASGSRCRCRLHCSGHTLAPW